MPKRKKPKTKKCSKCGKRKATTEFNKCRRLRDGLSCWCRNCNSESRNQWKEKLRGADPIGFWARNWVASSKVSAKRRRLTHFVQPPDLVELLEQQAGRCAVTGIRMTLTQGDGRCGTNVSVDRIDNAKGYEVGNVRLVCDRVNMMRSSMSDVELLWWCQQVVSNCTADIDTVSETYEPIPPIEPIGDIDIHSDD